VISGGVSASIAYDIYQSGSNPIRVAGDVLPTSSHWRAYAYYEDPSTSPVTKAAHQLQEPAGASESSARAIVAAGSGWSHAVGYAVVTNRAYACYWLVNHEGSIQLTNLGTTYLSAYTNSYALDTDGTRHVGYCNHGSDASNRGFAIVGTNAFTQGGAFLGISRTTGLVAGYWVSNGYTRPMYWRIRPGAASLSDHSLQMGGYSHGSARAVGDNDIIVGSLWNSASDEVACRWLTNGSVATLNSMSPDLQWNMTRAYNINSGSGKHTTGIMKNVFTGEARAFNFYGW
jgi:hypothetical protein